MAIRLPQADNQFNIPRRVQGVCSPMDMMPTILDYLSIKFNGMMDGRSLMPILSGGQDNDRIFFLEYPDHALPSTMDPDIYAARSATHKLIRFLRTGTDKIIKQDIYDITKDPLEQQPLPYDNSNQLQRKLSKELDTMIDKAVNYKLPFPLISYEIPIAKRRDFLDKRKNQPKKIIKTLTVDQIQKLKSLGYVR